MARSRLTSVCLLSLVSLSALTPACFFDWDKVRAKDAAQDTRTEDRVDVVTPMDNGPPDDGILDAGNTDIDVVDTVDVPSPMDTIDTPIVMDTPDVPTVMDVPADNVDTGPLPDVPLCTGFSAVLVINEVQHTGAGGGSDEFVEIANKSDCTAPLLNYTLSYQSYSSATTRVMWTGTSLNTIPPHGYVVVGGAAFTGAKIGSFLAGTGVGGSGGAVALIAPDTTRVDSVGYETGNTSSYVEMLPVATIANSRSAARVPDGTDTNNNSVDFVVGVATPNARNN